MRYRRFGLPCLTARTECALHLEEFPGRDKLLGELGEVAFAGDFAGDAEALHVRGELLDVHPGGAAGSEVLSEVEDGEFRGVGFVVEHAFAAEDAAGIDAVEATDEFFVAPDFDAVSETFAVEGGVGGDDGGGDPSAVLPWAERGLMSKLAM